MHFTYHDNLPMQMTLEIRLYVFWFCRPQFIDLTIYSNTVEGISDWDLTCREDFKIRLVFAVLAMNFSVTLEGSAKSIDATERPAIPCVRGFRFQKEADSIRSTTKSISSNGNLSHRENADWNGCGTTYRLYFTLMTKSSTSSSSPSSLPSSGVVAR